MIVSIRNLVLVLLAAIVAACNPMEQLDDADAEVAEFHQQMDNRQFDAIWEAGSKEFKASGPKADAVAFLGQIRDRMGALKSTTREGFNLNTDNGVTMVKVTHKSEFDNGPATETFDFVRVEDELQLYNYNINWGTDQGPAEPAE